MPNTVLTTKPIAAVASAVPSDIASISTAQALNYTLLVSYGSYGITGAAILGPKLLYSNAFRFTYTCSQSSCSYGNGTNVSMQLVYRNADTSIFKINYTR